MKPTIRLLILFFIVWGCSPQLGPQEVARIGRVVVAPADLYEILPKARFEAAPQEEKRRVIHQAAARKWLAQEALQKGFGQRQDVQDKVQGLYNRRHVDTFIQRRVWEPILSDSALYETYQRLQKVVGITHILIHKKWGKGSKSTRSEAEARRYAYSLWDRIRAGEITFQEAAMSFTEEPLMKTNKGDWGYVYWKDLYPEVLKVAWEDSSAYPHPIPSDFGYHLIHIRGSKAAPQKPFDQVKGDIQLLIKNGRLPEFKLALKAVENTLLGKYNVELFLDNLEALHDTLLARSPSNSYLTFAALDSITTEKPLAKIGDTLLYQPWFLKQRALEPMVKQASLTFLYDIKKVHQDLIVRHLAVLEARRGKMVDEEKLRRDMYRLREQEARKRYVDSLLAAEPQLTEEILENRVLSQQAVTINPAFLTPPEPSPPGR